MPTLRPPSVRGPISLSFAVPDISTVKRKHAPKQRETNFSHALNHVWNYVFSNIYTLKNNMVSHGISCEKPYGNKPRILCYQNFHQDLAGVGSGSGADSILWV